MPVDQPRFDPCPAIRVMMMPRDTNAHGTIFGGVILSYIDQAGAIEARKHTVRKFVTVAMDGVSFKEPVFVGDVLSFKTHLVSVGRTSMKINVCVEAERFDAPRDIVTVTEATLVYVAIDDQRHPVALELDEGYVKRAAAAGGRG
jgi:acyl-CoA thioesterase YciA